MKSLCLKPTGKQPAAINASCAALPLLMAFIVVILFTATVPMALLAQAPTLSYSTPQTYKLNGPITPLSPTSSGVAAPGYSTTVFNAGSGFNQPIGVATDAAGNVYVASQHDRAIYKIPGGTGTPVLFSSGGGLTGPYGLATDSKGNLYIADIDNGTVYKVPPAGGTPVAISTPSFAALGIAVDAADNVYFTDDDSKVWKIRASDGVTVSFASGFIGPTAIAVDKSGNVYVNDSGNSELKSIPAGGGTPTVVLSSFPQSSLAFDQFGNLLIYNQTTGDLEELPAGSSSTVIVAASINVGGSGMAVDGKGIIYFGNGNSSTSIKAIHPSGGYFSTTLPAGLSLNNATGVIGGAPTVASAATNYAVTGWNTSGGTTATINITVLTNNINLSHLAVSTGTLTPAFATATQNYTESVINTVTSIKITPTAGDPTATITVNGTTVASGSASPDIPLNLGLNTIAVVVKSSDGTVIDTYNLTVTRVPSSNAGLSNLTLSSATLSPAFATATSEYTAQVSSSTTGITVTPTISDPTATVTVNGVAVASGTASANIPLSTGLNPVNVVVTAQDGTTHSYPISVTRPPAGLSVSYGSPQTYTVGVPITPLVPVSGGVAAFSHGPTITIGTGFNTPQQAAADAAGNVYVADMGNNAIKKIPAGGGSPVVFASVISPGGVAVDLQGNVYTVDGSGGTGLNGSGYVKEFPANGGAVITSSTMVGNSAIAVDAQGNVYTASINDFGNGGIQVLPPGLQSVTSVAGGISPVGIAVDFSGNVFSGNTDGGTIALSILEFPKIAGTAVAANLNTREYGITGVAVDCAGNVFGTPGPTWIDPGSITEFPADGSAQFGFGSGFNNPYGLSIDIYGNIYAGDIGDNTVKEIKQTGGYYISGLPPGLKFDENTGIISGTPTDTSRATNYIITVYNSSGSATATLNIKVVLPPPPVISYSSPQSYTVGTAITPLAPAITGIVAPPAYSVPYYSTPYTPVINSSLLANPTEPAMDAAGNLYIGVKSGATIFKVAAGSTTVTAFGTGFTAPMGVAADAAGNVYVADATLKEVFKIPADGGAQTAIITGLTSPTRLAIDPAGNIYVLDNGVVKKYIGGAGAPVTLGTGIQSPVDIAVDATQNVYVSSPGYNTIKKILASDGSTITLVSSGLSAGLAVDGGGNVFASTGLSILEIPAGTNTLISVGGQVIGADGLVVDKAGDILLAQPNGIIAIKPTGGYYISGLPAGLSFSQTTGVISGTPTLPGPATNYTVTAYNAAGSGTTTATITVQANLLPPVINYGGPWAFAAGAAITPLSPTGAVVTPPGYTTAAVHLGSGFTEPTGVAVDAAGNAFVADWGNHAVKKIPSGGSPAAFGTGITQPYGIAVNAAGDVYVADYGSNSVKKIPAAGGSAVVVGTGFMHPMGLAVDATGNVYVADYGNNAVKKITAGSGTVVTLGSGFNLPTGVAVDNLGNVYVADFGNNVVKMIPAGGGAVVTLGTFSGPRDIVFDGGGNMYVTEYTTNDLKEVEAGGSSVVLASHYNHPAGLTIDGPGNLYVADFSNNLIDKYNPTGGFFITPFLPAGLNFSSFTGAITGTPTTPGSPVNYTVTAYNSYGSGSGTVSITIGNSSDPTNLANLVISSGTLTPAFASTTTSYSASVGTSVSSVTITPTAADPTSTITVNGTAVTSGTASSAILLSTGLHPITVVVTASGASATKTYTVNVGRGATNANLAALTLSAGTLSPAFATGTTGYTTTVTNATSSVTVTPTLSDPNAKVKVNGVIVSSGVASAAIPLVAGPNTITATVTAQDGVTTNTYTIVVTRTASSNAGLANIKTSPASSLLLTSGPGYLNFNSTVPNSFSSIQVIATAKDATATITVNGQAVASGSPSQVIPLNVGSNTLTTVITAQDGVTTETIIINCTRSAPPSHNSLFVQSSVVAPPETVTIADDGIVVHQAVSPNGDGVNDVFTIDGLTNYRDNKITIVDRNGNLVYEAKGYDNGSVVFDGHSNVDGKMQVAGTYFYSLEYKSGNVTKRQTGYIVLKY